MLMTDLHHLRDDQLVAAIAALNGAEREATAALIAHLAELEARDLHLAMGFRSLYRYCRAVLHLSEHESYSRMEAAHVVRRFPVIVPMVAEGLLHLTAVRLLAPHLGDENHLALLGGAIHKSKVEVKDLLAAWFPKPDVRTSIRRVLVPAAASAEATTPAPALVPAPVSAAVAVVAPDPVLAAPSEPAVPVRPPQRRKASIDPLSAESYALRLTAPGAGTAGPRRPRWRRRPDPLPGAGGADREGGTAKACADAAAGGCADAGARADGGARAGAGAATGAEARACSAIHRPGHADGYG